MSRDRREEVRGLVAGFPASVVPVAYALGPPPPMVPLGSLLAAGDPGPVLVKFERRLREARPELSEAERLALLVPASAGDQEVFLARLGKWRFELRALGG